MSTPPDDTPPAEEHTPDVAAAPAGGLRRWMPRRRTTVAPADTSIAPGEPAGDAPASDPAAAATEPSGEPASADRDAAPSRRWMPRRRAATPPAGDGAAPETDPSPAAAADGEADDDEPVTVAAAADGVGRLRRRRKRLLSEREVTVYHLGGLAFELYRHDLLHPEVMRRRAGEIALIDETVHDIDLRLEQLATDRRERRVREPDARTPVGNCVACRAPFQVDARFCWQCGARLSPELPDPPQGVALDDQATQTIERPTP